MDPKTLEEIFKRLDTIGGKLLEGGVKFGEVMTRGSYAAATSDLFIGAAMFAGSSVTVIAGMIGVAYLSSAIQIFIAPEWYAIKTLIGK
jgi:hypothetical protein